VNDGFVRLYTPEPIYSCSFSFVATRFYGFYIIIGTNLRSEGILSIY